MANVVDAVSRQKDLLVNRRKKQVIEIK